MNKIFFSVFSWHERPGITLCNVNDMFVRTALLILKHKLYEFHETGVNCEVISEKRGAYMLLAYISNYREQRP
jgi:hypothetical protein